MKENYVAFSIIHKKSFGLSYKAGKPELRCTMRGHYLPHSSRTAKIGNNLITPKQISKN